MAELERDFLTFRDGGSTRAMARVFDAVAPELLLVAGHLARDASSAEDLVQGTLLAAIEQRDRFDATRRLMPWLLGILVNLHRTERRRPKHSSVPETWPAKENGPERAAADAELVEQLDRVLSELPEAYREPLRLRLLHGLEPVQIAHALGRPLETVRTQLRRGRQHLRDALPASLAGVVVLDMGLGSDGLGAMRASVLASAGSVSSVKVGSMALGGLLVMKKWIAIAAVLLIVAGGLRWIGSSTSSSGSSAVAASPLEPTAPDRAASAPGVPRPETSARTELATDRLGPITTLECEVRWASDGQPASGVRMGLYFEAQDPLAADWRAVSDDRGRVRFDGTRAGSAWLYSDRGGSSRIEVVGGQANVTRFEVPEGQVVRGIVIDQDDRPVAGATLWVSDRPMRMRWGMECGVSGPDGRFELRDVEPLRLVSARLAGFEPSDAWVAVGETSDPAGLRLRLGPPTARLRGVVRGPDATPRSDAAVTVGEVLHHVRYTTDGNTFQQPPQLVHPDDEGLFEVDVPRSRGISIWARAPGTAIWHEKLTLDGTLRVLEIDLVAGAVVRGTVSDLSGRPVVDAPVTALQDGVGSGSGSPAAYGPSWAVPTTRTDGNGAFELADVLSGLTTILVRSPDGTQEVSHDLQLEPGTVARCDLVMGGEKRIVGVVVDELGRPVPGVVVSGHSEDSEMRRLAGVTTTTDGEFELADAWKASYTILLSEPDVGVNPTVQRSGVVPGGAPLRIEFSTAHLARSRLSGEIVDSSGLAVTVGDLMLDRIGADGRVQWGNRDIELEAGRFTTKPLPQGTYVLTYRAEYTGLDWRQEVDLGPAQDLDLGVIQLPTPGRIELICEGDFAPEMDATIHMDRVPWGIGLKLDDGRGLSGPLAPGDYRVGFSGTRGQAFQNVAAEVRAGETTRVRLVLGHAVPRLLRSPRVTEDGVMLTQTWFDANGRTLARLGWPIQRRESEAPYEHLLLPGHYRVVVETLDGRSAELEFVVSDAPESDEVIELPSPVLD